MFKKFLKWIEENRDYGITVFLAYDPISEKASITLFMSYISFLLSIISLGMLHFNEKLLMATGMSFLLTFMMVIFYLIRSINKANINFKERSVSLESNETNDLNKQNTRKEK